MLLEEKLFRMMFFSTFAHHKIKKAGAEVQQFFILMDNKPVQSGLKKSS